MALVMLHHSISPSEFFSYTNLPFSCVSNWTVPDTQRYHKNRVGRLHKHYN